MLALQLLGHQRRVWTAFGVEAQLLLALSAQRYDQFCCAISELLKDSLRAVSGIGEHLLWRLLEVGSHGLQKRWQLVRVAGAVGQLSRHDDVRSFVNRGLRVVARVEATACTLP